MRHPKDPDRHGRRGIDDIGPALDDASRIVGTAVIDDEHLDPIRESGSSGRTVTGRLATSPQIPDQLVEGRSDAVRLVVGGQHQHQRWRFRTCAAV